MQLGLPLGGDFVHVRFGGDPLSSVTDDRFYSLCPKKIVEGGGELTGAPVPENAVDL